MSEPKPVMTDEEIHAFFEPAAGQTLSPDAVTIGRRLLAEFSERVAVILDEAAEANRQAPSDRTRAYVGLFEAASIVRDRALWWREAAKGADRG